MAHGNVDERGFEMLRRIREDHTDMSLTQFKQMVREQFYMLLIDEAQALEALPAMIPDAEKRARVMAMVRKVAAVGGEVSAEVRERLHKVERLLGLARDDGATVTPLSPRRKQAS